MGSSPSSASAREWAGSGERCPARHHARAPGAMRSATSAAAVTTTPSSSSGVRRTADWAQKPAIAARSAPPQAARSATGSSRRSRDRYSASRTAAVLRDHAASSIPVPRPTAATGSVPISAAIRVVAAVVFPMPISPTIRRSAPASTSSSAIRRPASIAAIASSRSRASSVAMLPLERRTLCVVVASPGDWSRSTAISTTRTVAPAASARVLIAAPPASILATIWAVTSGG